MQNIKTDIVIIGAGAAGLMAAHFCSSNGPDICLLDHQKDIGRKILVSGGGRCNFTNIYSSPTDYYSKNPHFCKSALSRFSPGDFTAMLEEQGIEYYEKKLGQLFCKSSARKIHDMLLKKIEKANIKLLTEQKNIQVEANEGGFLVFNSLISIQTTSLIVATGGLVNKTLGASGFGHTLALKFGHKIIPTTPALVPFIIPGFRELAGISFPVNVSCNKHHIQEDLLFTHKGLSGPAILKASLFWNTGDPIVVNWLPKKSFEDIILENSAKSQIDTVIKRYLPKKFVDNFFERIALDGQINIGSLSKKLHLKINKELHSMSIIPKGTEGFEKAEVTRGGVDTSDISSKTLESKLQKGLYFIGEVLDITGTLGGHNLHWCWASAHAVGEAQNHSILY